jgi:hypothetical protein
VCAYSSSSKRVGHHSDEGARLRRERHSLDTSTFEFLSIGIKVCPNVIQEEGRERKDEVEHHFYGWRKGRTFKGTHNFMRDCY